jgi:hypothetical protein
MNGTSQSTIVARTRPAIWVRSLMARPPGDRTD